MSNNGISSIPGEYVMGLGKVERLGLRGNKLNALPENMDIFRSLESLDVAHNALPMLPDAVKRARMPLLRDFKTQGNPCATVAGEFFLFYMALCALTCCISPPFLKSCP